MDKGPRGAKVCFEKSRKIRKGLTPLEIKAYWKAKIIKPLRLLYKNKEVDLMEQDREFQEDPGIYGG